MKTTDPITVRFARPLALADLLGVDLHVSIFRKLGRWWAPRGPSFLIRAGRVDAMSHCEPRQLNAAVLIAAGRPLYPSGSIVVTRPRGGDRAGRSSATCRPSGAAASLQGAPRHQRGGT